MSRAIAESDLLSRTDLRFLLHEWLGVEQLSRFERFADGSRDDYDAIVDLALELASDRFAPHLRRGDVEEPTMGADGKVVLPDEVGEAVEVFAEAGLFGMGLDHEVGGLQLPHAVAMAVFACFHAANTGTTGYPYMTVGAADLLVAEGSDEQIATFVPPMAEGRWFGTMCLSEAQAGSSLADIRTRAEPQPDGTHRLFGTKTWITAGDHELGENIVHMVLARLPDAPIGVRGISLFIVPKVLPAGDGGLGERNDVSLAGLQHKMGTRATTNATLGFGEGAWTPQGRPGAIGFLVGEPGRGLTAMFHMMNQARIGVGLASAAIGYAAFRKSVRYAHERLQGRPLVGRDDAQGQVPIVEHTDVRRMLLAQKAYVEGGLALALYAAQLVDLERHAPDAETRAEHHLLLDVLTPIVKSWPSQWCLEANALAIQVHGGAGYTRDVDVELHYRDNRLNAIHEGTHGIQALDLLGRKAVMDGGAGLAALLRAIGATTERARAAGGEAARFAGELDASAGRLAEVTGALWAGLDPEVALANATAYLEAAGHVVVAWIWLEQLLAAGQTEGDFYDGKRQAARFFFRHELPRTAAQFDLLAGLDRTALDTDPAWL